MFNIWQTYFFMANRLITLKPTSIFFILLIVTKLIQFLLINFSSISNHFAPSPSSVLEPHVHERNARRHQRLGGRSHELRGHCHEFPCRQYHRKTTDQGGTTQEIQMPRVHQHRNVVGRSESHVGAISVHRPICRYLRSYAVAHRWIPGRSGVVQG